MLLRVQGVPSGRGLGFVDLDIDWSTFCPTNPRLVGLRHTAGTTGSDIEILLVSFYRVSQN